MVWLVFVIILLDNDFVPGGIRWLPELILTCCELDPLKQN